MRAYAAAHFAKDEVLQLRVSGWPCVVQSEYTGGGGERHPYPVTIFAELRGRCAEILEAQRHLANAIGDLLPVISIAANAAVENPIAVACFGVELDEPRPAI